MEPILIASLTVLALSLIGLLYERHKIRTSNYFSPGLVVMYATTAVWSLIALTTLLIVSLL